VASVLRAELGAGDATAVSDDREGRARTAANRTGCSITLAGADGAVSGAPDAARTAIAPARR
jgi:hypothetical protein